MCRGKHGGSGLSILRQGSEHLVQTLGNRNAVRKAPVVLIEGLPLAASWRQRLQILDHPGEALGLFRNRIGVGSRVIKSAPGLLPDVEGLSDGREFHERTCMIVQKLELIGGLQKRLMRMLPMYVNERFAEFPQLGSRHRDAVHPGAGASLDVDRPADHQHVVARFKLVGRKPFSGALRRLKLRHDVRALSTLTDDAGIRPTTKNQLQGIDENGLAGAGFTRQDCKAPPDIQTQGLDDHKVSKTQGSQHEGVSPEAVLKELLYQLPEEFVRLFTLVGMKFHLSLRRSRSK